MSKQQVERAEKRRREVEEALIETVEDTIRRHGPMNALVWTAVTAGAFLLNLGLLVLVSGG